MNCQEDVVRLSELLQISLTTTELDSYITRSRMSRMSGAPPLRRCPRGRSPPAPPRACWGHSSHLLYILFSCMKLFTILGLRLSIKSFSKYCPLRITRKCHEISFPALIFLHLWRIKEYQEQILRHNCSSGSG